MESLSYCYARDNTNDSETKNSAALGGISFCHWGSARLRPSLFITRCSGVDLHSFESYCYDSANDSSGGASDYSTCCFR